MRQHKHGTGHAYVAGCAGCQALSRERQRRQYAANPEVKRAAERRYREANPEKYRAAQRRYREANPEKYRAAVLASTVKQLQRGEQIASIYAHHKAMAAWKAQLGDLRLPGMTLSLINWDSPSAYDGYHYANGERVPYRLSVDPNDYAWETQADNNARRRARRAAA